MPILPTTMVGSYPRPAWFTQQLAGRDVLEAFKVAPHAEAFHDATRVAIGDQEAAGLDVVTDGQMWFDDYAMGIGSFLWYWLERTGGFSKEKLPHPARGKAHGRDVWALDEAGGVAVEGPIARGPVRMAVLYRWAQRHTQRPIKACVGAGPVQLSTLAHFRAGPITVDTSWRARSPTSSPPRSPSSPRPAAATSSSRTSAPGSRPCRASATTRGSARSSTA